MLHVIFKVFLGLPNSIPHFVSYFEFRRPITWNVEVICTKIERLSLATTDL